MRVLILKMSSLGDVIHTLPALTDAGKAIKGITFDWVVEEQFQEIPSWHPLVKNVIPIAMRRWRKNMFSPDTKSEWQMFKKILRENQYDLIIDAQGLLKSAFIARLAKGPLTGLGFTSAREKLASFLYGRRVSVEKGQHAIHRLRQLFAKSVGYALPDTLPDYGLRRDALFDLSDPGHYFVFLHGTTWQTKHWPEEYWKKLAELVVSEGYRIKLPWGTKEERASALRIASENDQIEVLPRVSLREMAEVLAGAKVVVGVDTGLGHLAAALDVPMISLYGPTNPKLTGALGRSQIHLRVEFPCSPCLSRVCTYQKAAEFSVQPPCFSTLPPDLVWAKLQEMLQKSH